MRLLHIVACSSVLPLLAHAQYAMVKEYIGEKFFDDWNFYGKGEVNFDGYCQLESSLVTSIISG